MSGMTNGGSGADGSSPGERLRDAAIDAHGGLELWRRLESIEATVRCGGIAFPMKGQRGALRRFRATVDPHRPHVVLEGVGTFSGEDPRPAGMPRRLRWTREDITHFAGYALWNYLAMPFLLIEHDVEVRELSRRRLRLRFPPGLPTHSREQTLWLSEDAVIERLDYRADPMGPWAYARNVCLENRRVDGLLFAVRRRVAPRGLPGPTLVSIAIDDIEPTASVA
jgi:hypothetical protein